MQYIDENVKIIASNESEGETMKNNVETLGGTVEKVLVWDGPVPENSFTYYAPGIRMATAEYYFLRKANWLSFGEAVYFGNELVGKYRSHVTEGANKNHYNFLRYARTDKSHIAEYLDEIKDTTEGKRALEVLDCTMEGCVSPIANYVATILTLPAEHGGYGLSKPELGAVYKNDNGFMPAASGRFLAYDLCWKKGDDMFTLQYADHLTSDADALALIANGVRNHVMFKDQLEDPDFLDVIAVDVSLNIGEKLPKRTDEWNEAHAKLLASIEMPTYEHMESTYRDIMYHC